VSIEEAMKSNWDVPDALLEAYRNDPFVNAYFRLGRESGKTLEECLIMLVKAMVVRHSKEWGLIHDLLARWPAASLPLDLISPFSELEKTA
jgi:hypothetical protein